MSRPLWLGVVLLLCGGCGGAISSAYIVQGSLALAGARAANAETLATYEYVSAEAYLKKARESHSYADFEHSLRFARIAANRAEQARKRALEQKQSSMPVDLVSPDAAPPPGAPAPAPAPVIIQKQPEGNNPSPVLP